MSKKPISKQTVLKNIIDNYENLETSIVKQLFFDVDNHGTTVGSHRENIWKSLFEQMVPKKFKIERSVFIIDSNFGIEDSKSGVSNEVDIVIYDDSYTPYIFQYGLIKFIPIEAVAVAIECKSTSINHKPLENWTNSIRALKTNSKSVTRLATTLSVSAPKTQLATRPLLINCNIAPSISDDAKKLFDIVLQADEKNSKIKVLLNPNEKNSLIHYFYYMNQRDEFDELLKENQLNELNNLSKENRLNELNDRITEHINIPGVDKVEEAKKLNISIDEYRIKNADKEISLLSLNFMLNQILMLLNNPMLFPHKAYVDMFNDALKDK